MGIIVRKFEFYGICDSNDIKKEMINWVVLVSFIIFGQMKTNRYQGKGIFQRCFSTRLVFKFYLALIGFLIKI